MKQFRKIIFWLHLTAGVLAGIFILIMCVTGAALSFESNILEFAEREMRVVEIPPENARPLTIQEIVYAVQSAKSNAKLSNVTVQNNKSAAVTIGLGREGQVFVNPYTGSITGEGDSVWRDFFRMAEDLHRWLAIPGDGRAIGKNINDFCNLLFLFLAISGIYIWFPRRISLQHFKPILWFRRGLHGKARNFNWHNTIGFWSSLILIILTLTAVVMSYSWANNLVYTLTGNELPQQTPATAAIYNQSPEEKSSLFSDNIGEIWTKAENFTDWKTISLRLPVAREAAVFSIDEGIYRNKFGRSILTIDTKTAAISKWEPYGEQNSGRRLRSWVRFTHTGETGGIIGQSIGFAACVGGAFLVWTGFALAWRRFQTWRARRTNEDAAV